MNRAVGFLILSLLVVPAIADSAKKPPSFKLTKLESVYKDAGSLEFDFVQEVFQELLARTSTSTGHIQLSKPHFLLWKTDQPERSVLVSDGKKVHYYTPEAGVDNKGQVMVQPLGFLTRHPLYQILAGRVPMTKQFRQDKVESRGKAGFLLTLVPRKRMADLTTVELKISPKYRITEMKLNRSSGNWTRFTLKNIELGAKLPTKLFRFVAPSGTEIVESKL